MKVARQSGKYAFITYDSLVVRDWKKMPVNKEINCDADDITTHEDM